MLPRPLLPVLAMNSQCPLLDAAVPPAAAAILPASAGHFGSSRSLWGAIASDAELDTVELARELWRQAVHDLRGKLGVVTNVTALLQQPCSEPRRSQLVALLNRNVVGLGDLLDGVADLARLDAKKERPVVRTFDIATTLDTTCGNLQVLARSRGIQLEFCGPRSLIADSDPLMVTRIAQNLLLNAIQYTHGDGVRLTCGPCEAAEASDWYFEVGGAEVSWGGNDLTKLLQTSSTRSAPGSSSGEGIGLSIVKRLCSLLGGSMAVEYAGGTGRITRIRLPRRYPGPAAVQTISAIGGRLISVPSVRSLADLQSCQPRLDAPPPANPGAPLTHS